MWRRGSCILWAFACFLLVAKPASAQSNLLQADLGKGLENADLSLHPNMVDLPLVLDGTIFSADPFSMRGDFSEDGGNFNISYRFGKNFMGFDGHFTGSTGNQNTSLATNGIFGIRGLNIRGGAGTLRYRIGRIVAPGVAVYGMVGTTSLGNKSYRIIPGPISSTGSSADLGIVTTELPDNSNSSSDDDGDDDRSGSNSGKGSGDDDDDSHHGTNGGHDDDDDHEDTASVATVTSVAISENTSTQQSPSTSSQSLSLSSGIILGGGVEMLVGNGVYIRAEYNFVDANVISQTFDFTKTATDNFVSNGALSNAKNNEENDIHSVGFSVLYRF